ncbi:Tat pathway signal protein [Natronococcus pandeyae]|uniref:Tat pathway signal protein n=1 Tax=Natronococcus pandeyae TaxID=2055836 RepID=A0A8J8TSY8_9EURY|nr:Dyp-type peroxidase domain-containing protein [Natronococcus pandeyae]TYL39279.1 Tat pathway signal protein [Natronococcus pandeyae]
MPRPDRGLSRRAFVRSAVAVGGAGALAACTSREEDADVPQADLDPEELPDRQHAWNEFLDRDDHGNVRPPEHHLLLGLEYVGGGLDGSGDPDDAERERLEDAFTTLERAYGRGNDGLAFTVGYGPTYFDRFDGDLPEGVDLPEPEPLAPIEDPDLDAHDALLHLASDHGHVILSAEEALTGALEEINDVSVEGTLEGVLEVTDRRTGFVGEGIPAENQAETRGIPDSEPVPDDAPFFMGFKSGFERNQASEDRVTIPDGPFEGGTTTHLSKIDLNLQQWYEQDSRDQRVAKLFCPAHADEDRVEGAGHNLGDSSGVEGCIEDAETDARNGLVGHAQKAGRAREDGDPIILRRDFNSTDDDQAGLQFLSHQRSIADFVATRAAMTGGDLTDGAIDSRLNNGILQYVRVRRRANYLVPPRRYRALPTPNPE